MGKLWDKNAVSLSMLDNDRNQASCVFNCARSRTSKFDESATKRWIRWDRKQVYILCRLGHIQTTGSEFLSHPSNPIYYLVQENPSMPLVLLQWDDFELSTCACLAACDEGRRCDERNFHVDQLDQLCMPLQQLLDWARLHSFGKYCFIGL